MRLSKLFTVWGPGYLFNLVFFYALISTQTLFLFYHWNTYSSGSVTRIPCCIGSVTSCQWKLPCPPGNSLLLFCQHSPYSWTVLALSKSLLTLFCVSDISVRVCAFSLRAETINSLFTHCPYIVGSGKHLSSNPSKLLATLSLRFLSCAYMKLIIVSLRDCFKK